MPRYWMVTNRNDRSNEEGGDAFDAQDGLGANIAPLSYWLADKGPLDRMRNWREVDVEEFKATLVAASNRFPLIEDPARNSEQRHIGLFIHGFNVDWADAARRYESISKRIFEGEDGLGMCILFSWPSNGHAWEYLPDRAEAQRCAADLSLVLSEFYDWGLKKQQDSVDNPKDACRAKISVIAHSMGNYVLQKALQSTWTRKNRPLLVSLINQLVMVAADVDNDLFQAGEAVDGGDGDAIANLTYRVTALYTGRDEVLGMSAGLKHFGKRRLGRSGLDRALPPPDNVWDLDCSELIPKNAKAVHSAYFDAPRTLALLKQLLRGVDRGVISSGL